MLFKLGFLVLVAAAAGQFVNDPSLGWENSPILPLTPPALASNNNFQLNTNNQFSNQQFVAEERETFVPQQQQVFSQQRVVVEEPIVITPTPPVKGRKVPPAVKTPLRAFPVKTPVTPLPPTPVFQQRKSLVRRDTNFDWSVKGQQPLPLTETRFLPESPVKGQRLVQQPIITQQQQIIEEPIVQQEQVIITEAPARKMPIILTTTTTTTPLPIRHFETKGQPIIQQEQREIIQEPQPIKGQLPIEPQRFEPVVQQEQVFVPEPLPQQQEIVEEPQRFEEPQVIEVQQQEVKGQRVIETPIVQQEQFPVKGQQVPLDDGLALASAPLPTHLRSGHAPCQTGPPSAAAMRLGLPHGVDTLLPNLDAYSFSCAGRAYGYYADVANHCQVYHVCSRSLTADLNPSVWQMVRSSYFCPAGTLFDQRLHVCVLAEEAFPCAQAPSLYPHTEMRFSAPLATPTLANFQPSASHLRSFATMAAPTNFNKGGVRSATTFLTNAPLPVAMASNIFPAKGQNLNTVTRSVVSNSNLEFGTKLPTRLASNVQNSFEIPSQTNIPIGQGQFLGTTFTSPARKLQQGIN